MTRRICCSLALALAACATPGRAHAPAAPRFELCSDPQFQCAPATAVPERDARPIQVDTNFAAPQVQVMGFTA